MATAMAGLDNFKVVEFEKFHESLCHLLHPNHYLMVLLKRHIIGLYSSAWTDLTTEDMERVSFDIYLLRHLFTPDSGEEVL